MNNLKNTIVATAAALAIMAPLTGAAQANYNGFESKKQRVDAGRKGIHRVARTAPRTRARGRQGRPGHGGDVARAPDWGGPTPLRRSPFALHARSIDDRIARQRRRIRSARASGRLTRFEAIRLRGRLAAIRAARNFAGLDGRIDFQEYGRLTAMLNKNSRRIRRLANNANSAGRGYWGGRDYRRSAHKYDRRGRY